MERLDGITNSMNVSLSKVLERVKDRGAWCAAVHGVTKSRTRLALRIPGMGEPEGLPSMGSHRVGHD